MKMLKAKYGLAGAHWEVRVFVNHALSGTLKFRAGEEERDMWAILRSMPHVREDGDVETEPVSTVMVVEDDHQIADIVAKVLRPYFSQIWICHNAEEAIDGLRRILRSGDRLDAVVTDFDLGMGANGQRVLEEVMTLFGPAPHRVLMSGMSRKDVPNELYDKFVDKMYNLKTSIVAAIGLTERPVVAG